MSAADLSVVIPVGPGDRAWPGLLNALDALAPDLDVLLVFARGDVQARPKRRRWIDGRPGRARQQNLGARATAGATLWFLHADSRVDLSVLTQALDFAARRPAAIGYFQLRFENGPMLMRINEFGVRLRCRWFALPFGDQGLIMPRAVFDALGQFEERRSYGEDMALVRRGRQQGLALESLPATIITSARRYAKHGWLRTTWQHQRMTWSVPRA